MSTTGDRCGGASGASYFRRVRALYVIDCFHDP